MKKFGILVAVTSITASLLTAVALAAPSQAAACKSGGLATLNKGVLTIGTDNPAYSPWFDNNTPSNGKGFESAVAYAVAKQLGYPAAKVKWVKAPFNAVIQPGKKSYDFDINQVSITPERAKAVDFSSGYYDVAQAIVTVAGSKIENAKSIKDLVNAKLGAAVGTTSYTTITSLIKPKTKASVYDSNDVATQALINGQIDGLVLDLPTAFYVAYVQLKKGAIVGQFAAKAGGEQFGLVLTKGSALTSCVSAAVDALRNDGSLKAIDTKWLSSSAGVPVLK